MSFLIPDTPYTPYVHLFADQLGCFEGSHGGTLGSSPIVSGYAVR